MTEIEIFSKIDKKYGGVLMKKIILMVFLVLGVMSFSVMDKVIIVVQNDNYETPFITGTYSRGIIM